MVSPSPAQSVRQASTSRVRHWDKTHRWAVHVAYSRCSLSAYPPLVGCDAVQQRIMLRQVTVGCIDTAFISERCFALITSSGLLNRTSALSMHCRRLPERSREGSDQHTRTNSDAMFIVSTDLVSSIQLVSIHVPFYPPLHPLSTSVPANHNRKPLLKAPYFLVSIDI